MLGVVGLGYVGFTSFLGFSKYSDSTIGFDISSKLIKDLSSGRLHIYDKHMYEHFSSCYNDLNLTNDLNDLAQCSDIIIAVPTNACDGGLDLSIVHSVLDQISNLNPDATIWIRSTVDDPHLFKILSEKYSNKVIFFPEFLREGKCWNDFNSPSLTVIGSDAVDTNNFLLKLIKKNAHDVQFCSAAEAITLKLACNSFHALKVCFANEINNLLWSKDIDPTLVMDLFAKDEVLNISKAYLKPGLPFGGPCLPKDTFALSLATNDGDNLFSRLIEVNENHKRVWSRKIEQLSQQVIGFIGLEFKPQTGDYKNSPIIDILGLINNKKIIILADEQKMNEQLKKYKSMSTVADIIDSADIVITYDKSIVASNVVFWEQL